MQGYKSKIFCKGILCDNWNRKNIKCQGCGLYLCGICSIKCNIDNKIYCPNCYIKSFISSFDNLNSSDKIRIEEMATYQKNKNNERIIDD